MFDTRRKEEEFKVQLAGLEAELIQALASSTGNILENTALIESLTKTKLKSAEIERALEASAEASEELDRQRNVYRPFAQAGSMIYFLIQDLRRCVCLYACMHVCMYVRMYVRIFGRMFTRVCMHACLYACLYVCAYVWMYVCMFALQCPAHVSIRVDLVHSTVLKHAC